MEEKPQLTYTLYSPAVSGPTYIPGIHSSCICNEYAGLRLRMLREVTLPTMDGMAKMRKVYRQDIWRRLARIPEVPLEAIVAKYTGRWRVRYERALAEYLDRGFVPRDAKIRAFVKREKYDLRKDKNKPRMIWGRGPVYNLLLASYLHPIEGELYRRMRTPKRCLVPPTRIVAKGLNGPQRANLIRRKMAAIRNCVAFEVDMTAFEAHHSEDALRLEHQTYRRMNSSPFLAHLLSFQSVNKGKTQMGITFERVAGRASGDFNTGLGNSLSMTAMTLAALDEIVPDLQRDILVDGDNALIFVEAPGLPRLEGTLEEVFRSFGHEAKVERPTQVLEEIRFGQSAPLQLDESRWTMVRDPWKVLSQAFTSHRHYGEIKGGLPIAKCVAQCELVLNSGVPVLQRFAQAALLDLRGVKFARRFEAENYEHAQVAKDAVWQQRTAREVTQIARESFQRAYGISVADQVRLESELVINFPRSWTDPVDPVKGRERDILLWQMCGFDR